MRATDAGRALTSCASVARGDARIDAITTSKGKTADRVMRVISTVSAGRGSQVESGTSTAREADHKSLVAWIAVSRPNECNRREMRQGTYCVIRNNRQLSGQRDFRDAMIGSTQASGDRPSHRNRHPGTTGERPLPRRSRHARCSCRSNRRRRVITACPPRRSHRHGRAIASRPART